MECTDFANVPNFILLPVIVINLTYILVTI